MLGAFADAEQDIGAARAPAQRAGPKSKARLVGVSAWRVAVKLLHKRFVARAGAEAPLPLGGRQKVFGHLPREQGAQLRRVEEEPAQVRVAVERRIVEPVVGGEASRGGQATPLDWPKARSVSPCGLVPCPVPRA